MAKAARRRTELTWLLMMLLGAGSLGTVRAQAVTSPETPPKASPPAEDLDLLRRLSLARPLEGGFDTPFSLFAVHGYLMLDAATYVGSGFEGSDIEIRRADINFQRRLWHDWLFYADSELVNWKLEFKDIYLRKSFDSLGAITIGNQQEPFGLEQYGSFRNTTFLERATISAIAPSRSVGITSSDFHGPWVWSYGLFTAGTKDEGREQRGVAFTGRVAYAWHQGDDLYHFALALSERWLGANKTQRFKSAPEVAMSSVDSFLDTGKIPDGDAQGRYGLEAAHVRGPFSWQAEYMGLRLRRENGLPSLDFHGWYVYASWMLTGESRPYRESNATFGGVVPGRPWDGRSGGALELAVRLSSTDLNDGVVTGGKETNLTVGVNWYLDKALRLSANVVHALDLDKPGSAHDGQHPSALVARLQYQF